MDIEMTLAAIQEQRERDAAKLAVTARAGEGDTPSGWHRWHAPSDASAGVGARLRWLLHLADGAEADADVLKHAAR